MPLPRLAAGLGSGGDHHHLVRHHSVLFRCARGADGAGARLDARPPLGRLFGLAPDGRPSGPSDRAACGSTWFPGADVVRLAARWGGTDRDLTGAPTMAVLPALVRRHRAVDGAEAVPDHVHGDHELVLAPPRLGAAHPHAARGPGPPYLHPAGGRSG